MGYSGFDPGITSDNVFGKDFKKCWNISRKHTEGTLRLRRRKRSEPSNRSSVLNSRQRAASLHKTNNDVDLNRSNHNQSPPGGPNHKKSNSFAAGSLSRRRNPVLGYTGHIRRIDSDNIYGVTYSKIFQERDKSIQNIKKWEKRAKEVGSKFLFKIEKGKRHRHKIKGLPKLRDTFTILN